MSLVGLPLLVVAAAAAVLLPLLLVVFWRRVPGRVLGVVIRLIAVLVCQALAVFAAGVALNRTFGFYNSWSDLLGQDENQGQLVPSTDMPDTGGAGASNMAGRHRDGRAKVVRGKVGPGKVVSLTVQGRVAKVRRDVLVWLPPQYNDPAYAKVKFPVLMVLPGQPGSPEGIYKTLKFGRNAPAAIGRGTVAPFVAVFPPLMIDPPRDTECTDVPNGPQADSWLSVDVREAVARNFRVKPTEWSAMGWSTGGFCAAKMLLRHPKRFAGAASIGGYYRAAEDPTTGVLFGGSKKLQNQNSPLYLIKHTKARPVRLLIVASKVDTHSWSGLSYADSQQMVAAAAGVPGVGTLLMERGGHNWNTYGPTVGPSLDWLGSNSGL